MRLEFQPPYRLHLTVPIVLAGTVWIGGIAAAWLLERVGIGPGAICWFKEATGVACPTCGLTRGIEYIATGRVWTGLTMNPLLFVGLSLAGICLLVRLLTGRSVRLVAARRTRRWGLAILAIAFVANWANVMFHTG
jgi:hypothetical protein